MPLALSLLSQFNDPYQFLILGTLAAGLSTMAKAGFGGGIGMLSTPLMVFACGGDGMTALGIMLPMLIVSDYVILFKWWGQWNARAALSLAPGAFIGLGLGWWTLAALQDKALAGQKETTNSIMLLSIGLIAIGFVVLHVWRSLRKNPLPFRPVLWQATSVGLAAGYTSTLAHAAGPIVTMYLLPQGMSKSRFVATTALYYWYGNQIKLLPFVWLGIVNLGTLQANIALLPGVVAGAFLGVYLHHRVGEKQFAGVVYVLLALAGLDFVIRAGIKLLA